MATSRALVLNNTEKALLREAKSYVRRSIISLPTSNETRLEERLSYFRFDRRNVVQDNHSFFRTLSDQLFGTQADHPLMRVVIAVQLRKNPLLYRKHVSGDYNSYCNKVATNHFGDIACAMAACDLFAVSFVQLLDDEGSVMIEVAPTKIHGNEEQLISSIIYSYKSGKEMHSMVPCSEHHLDDPIVRMKVHQLKHNLHDPDVILEICKSLLKHRPKRIVPMNEYKRLSQRLDFFGFRRKEMIGDGNCLFRSLSDRLYNNQEHHFRMRSVIVAKLKDDPERYENKRYKNPLFKGERYNDYCRRMASNGEWGDMACIQAACDAFGVKIMLLDAHPILIFREFVPDGPCKKVIYVCKNSHHMDAMYPLAELSQEESEEGVDEIEIDFRESLIAIFEERANEIEIDFLESVIAIFEEREDEIEIDKRGLDSFYI